jgi:hypothetical protein
MLGTWFKNKRAGARKLTPEAVRALVESFLRDWPPFRERFEHMGTMTMDWVKETQNQGHWVATVTPAIDIRCAVVVADDPGAVTEARLTAMRGGSVLAIWPQP